VNMHVASHSAKDEVAGLRPCDSGAKLLKRQILNRLDTRDRFLTEL
jgi:hypothetical protein